MNMEEVSEMLKLLPEIDIKNLNIEEQIMFISATYEFAKKIKPLVMKYAMKNHARSTFLMRLE